MKKKEIKEMSNFELLYTFQAMSGNTHGVRPTAKAYRELTWIINELGQRLDLTEDEIKKLIET